MKNEIGVISNLTEGAANLHNLHEYGLSLCQLCCWNSSMMTEEMADAVRMNSREFNVKIHSLWAGWPGPKAWNFTEGPECLGLIPAEYRRERIEALKKAVLFAEMLNLPAIITHLGFVPENPHANLFKELIDAVTEIAVFLKDKNMEFWFETGQETPVTLLRLIKMVNTGNLGINLDPANLIMYGKGNPVDALDVLGQYVKCIHVKDGIYPTDPMQLGKEVKVGMGSVNFKALIPKLLEQDYQGPFIIEREISGKKQLADVKETVLYLKSF